MSRKGRKPNFFIVGAPKAGTTAMADYLREHPDVFMSDPKEPFYWCSDFPALRKRERVETAEDYQKLFRRAKDKSRVGEASVLYLYSQVAIPAIWKQAPDSQFIAMLRHPLDVVQAFHMQMRFHFFEDEPDFEKAWRLQEARRNGQLPSGCLVPQLLQYQALGSLGEQVRRLFNIVPRSQVCLSFFDDFKQDPGAVYRSILTFVNVRDDNRQNFPRRNEAMISRHPALTRLLRLYPVRVASRSLKRILPASMIDQARDIKHAAMRRKQPRPPLREEFRRELLEVFRDDICLLQELSGRDLTHWQN